MTRATLESVVFTAGLLVIVAVFWVGVATVVGWAL